MDQKSLSRRGFVALSPLALAACAGSPSFFGGEPREIVATPPRRFADPGWEEMYAEIPGEQFPVPAIDTASIEPEYLRQVVRYDASHHAGAVIVDPSNYFLYLSLGEGRAVRYGVGVGREGFGWNGAAQIRRKAVWPRWTPPAAMIKRRPELAEWASGMPGGLENPLGARALYLYQGERDTLYRIHGTNEPDTIGSSVSSGCIRMFNQDVIDLHRRVLIGARVVVLPAMSQRPPALS